MTLSPSSPSSFPFDFLVMLTSNSPFTLKNWHEKNRDVRREPTNDYFLNETSASTGLACMIWISIRKRWSKVTYWLISLTTQPSWWDEYEHSKQFNLIIKNVDSMYTKHWKGVRDLTKNKWCGKICKCFPTNADENEEVIWSLNEKERDSWSHSLLKKKKKVTEVSEMVQRVKVFTSKSVDLSSWVWFSGPSWCKERTDSVKVFSNLCR